MWREVELGPVRPSHEFVHGFGPVVPSVVRRSPLEDPPVGPTLPSHTLALGEAWWPNSDLSSARPGPVGRYNRSVPRAGDSPRKPKLLPTLWFRVKVDEFFSPALKNALGSLSSCPGALCIQPT